MPDFEYYEGTKIIEHEDGSTTHIHTTHEPYVEPLTPKQALVLTGICVATVGGIIGLPFAIERLDEWSSHRREVRRLKKAKKLADLKSQTEQ